QAQHAQEAHHVQQKIQSAVAEYKVTHHHTHGARDTGDDGDTGATCQLDARWVQLHNAAARNVSPTAGGAGQPHAAPARPGDALGVVTHNYAIAHVCASRLQSWQRWYR